MLIASWNVNSVRARIENIKSYLIKYKPEILMMQEIKTEELNFPYEDFSSLDYESHVFGQKSYNGVAIISKNKLFCIGNHLYNHFNASLLNEIDLIKNYNKNRMTFLNNFIDYFSYPYGQKNTCYNNKTNKILIKNGAKAIFTANPLNFENKSLIFHRFPIDESFNSERILLAKLNYRRIRNFFK